MFHPVVECSELEDGGYRLINEHPLLRPLHNPHPNHPPSRKHTHTLVLLPPCTIHLRHDDRIVVELVLRLHCRCLRGGGGGGGGEGGGRGENGLSIDLLESYKVRRTPERGQVFPIKRAHRLQPISIGLRPGPRRGRMQIDGREEDGEDEVDSGAEETDECPDSGTVIRISWS